MIEWVKALVPVVVAIIPVLVTVIRTAKETRNSTAGEIRAVRDALAEHVKKDEEMDMKLRRIRILRFADEVAAGAAFSEEYWNDILEDIDDYEKFCEAHKDTYRNNKGHIAMMFIKDQYERRYKKL